MGVEWLTNNKSDTNKNVSRLKSVKVGNKVVVLFEYWTPDSYVSTALAVIDSNGKIIKEIQEIDYPLRLIRCDDIQIVNENVVVYSGEKGKILRYELFL